MMGYGMMDGYGFGLFGMIFNLAIIIAFVFLIVWAIRRFTGGAFSAGGQTPREILQMRYARGEITRDQYQQMLKDLA
jgi:putative membrane protein